MKDTKKLIAVLALAALLLTGCNTHNVTTAPATTTVPTASDTQMDHTDDLTLSKQQEIENAWYAAMNCQLGEWYEENTDGVRHYGSFNGYDVIYLPTFDAAITIKKVGNVVFENNYTFELYAYSNGRFYDLKQAYEVGLLTDESLEQIAQIHTQYQNVLIPDRGDDSLPYDVEAQMKAAFLRQFVKEEGHTQEDLTVVYYGEYDEAHVAFINGIFMYTQAFTSEQVGGFIFNYRTGQKLLVYYDGKLMGLGEAYKEGILSDDAIAKLHQAYHWEIPGITE